MIPVNKLIEIPEFKTRAEEIAFWETHDIGPDLPMARGIPKDELAILTGQASVKSDRAPKRSRRSA